MTFDNAMDEAEAEREEDSEEETDAGAQFIERASGDGVKDATMGIAVTEEMLYLYKELNKSEDVDVDLPQTLREQVKRMVKRHPEIADKARRRYELDNE